VVTITTAPKVSRSFGPPPSSHSTLTSSRRESGTSECVQVNDELVAQARACLAHAPGPTVYARVDGVVKDGQFLLMELEAFEPLMFLACHPEAPARFARAIARRLLLPPLARCLGWPNALAQPSSFRVGRRETMRRSRP
jgi:hypothetical protein